MAKDTLIDKHVSTKQCEKAIEALLKYTQKRRAEEDESTLFRDEEQAIWLVIALKQMQPTGHKLKPHRMYALADFCIFYARPSLQLVYSSQSPRPSDRRSTHNTHMPHHKRPSKKVQGSSPREEHQVHFPCGWNYQVEGQI